ncbi:MAG: hypothetical protein AB7S41_04445 [Parvibaculaceae bacterium]
MNFLSHRSPTRTSGYFWGLLIAALIQAFGAAPAAAQEKPSWRGCAVDFLRNVSDLANLRLDVPPEKLGVNAKLMADILAKEGLASAAMQVHGAYAKCTAALAKESAPRDPQEQAASQCAAGIVGRASILARIRNGETREVVELELPKEVTEVVRALYKAASEESFTKAVWASLDAGVDCVEKARKQSVPTP